MQPAAPTNDRHCASDCGGLFVADRSQLILALDERLATACGYQARELAGRPVTAVLSTALADVDQDLALRRSAAAADSPARQVLVRCRDATLRAASLRVRALDGGGAPLYVGSVKFATPAADECAMPDPAWLARDTVTRWVAGLGHDLRNSVNVVAGVAHLGARFGAGADIAKLISYFEHIERAGLRMLELLNILIDLGRLDAGALAPRREAHDIDALIREVCGEFEPLFAEKPVALDFARDPATMAAAIDAGAIARVLENLLGNALKFTPPGGAVRVDLRRADGFIEIEVEDNGPGIPIAERERIFMPFVRLNGARFEDGAGLGLAVASELVRAHGGRIDVETGTGGGARFVIRLPAPLESGDAGQ